MRKTVLAGLLAGLLAASGAQALSLSIDPSVLSAPQGSAFAFDVRISDLGAEVLSTYDISVSFNPAVLGLNSVAFGSAMNLGVADNSFQLVSTGAGSVNVIDTTATPDAALMASQADSFVLFRLNFTGVGVGSSAIGLTANILGGHSEPDPIFGDLFPVQLQASVEDGRAVVTQNGGGGGNVPEPGSFALAGLALAGLLASSRKRAA